MLEIRARLMANPWAQVGATAIAWEMEKLKLVPWPLTSALTIRHLIALRCQAEPSQWRKERSWPRS